MYASFTDDVYLKKGINSIPQNYNTTQIPRKVYRLILMHLLFFYLIASVYLFCGCVTELKKCRKLLFYHHLIAMNSVSFPPSSFLCSSFFTFSVPSSSFFYSLFFFPLFLLLSAHPVFLTIYKSNDGFPLQIFSKTLHL